MVQRQAQGLVGLEASTARGDLIGERREARARQFAQATLPKLKTHLQLVEQLTQKRNDTAGQ